jgi:hypothetical protein
MLQVLHIAQILRRDFRDRNVINVDILLADKVQQQIKRAVIDLPDAYRERKFICLRLGGL